MPPPQVTSTSDLTKRQLTVEIILAHQRGKIRFYDVFVGGFRRGTFTAEELIALRQYLKENERI